MQEALCGDRTWGEGRAARRSKEMGAEDVAKVAFECFVLMWWLVVG